MTDTKKYPITLSVTIDDFVQAFSDADISNEDMMSLIKRLNDAWEDDDFTKLLYDYAIKQQKKHDKETKKLLASGNSYWVSEDDLWKKPKKSKKAKV